MEETSRRIAALETEMLRSDFWSNKEKAQAALKELNALKEKQKEAFRYDGGDAALTILAGAGGDDAEDWARMLFTMYERFCERRGFTNILVHEHKNERGGVKNITFEVRGGGAYGLLKGESGVHRLVRISPFSAKKLRHTSFALVEVIPRFVKPGEVEVSPEDVTMEYSRSGGPGGQNVNKRDTAVRLVHKPTGLAVHASTERTQERNRERAMALLASKLYAKKLRELEEEKAAMQISKDVSPEWGRQIRSYVLHPYKLVKDHRTGEETSDVMGVLDGNLEHLIAAEKKTE